MFGSRLKAEEFGALLRVSYAEMCIHALQKLNEEIPSTTAVDSKLGDEVGALIYFAFDLGMASGTETTLRNRIRDGFLAAAPPSAGAAKLMADRSDEYATAMRNPDRERGMLALGKVFTDHTGQGPNVFAVMRAIAHFRSSYNMVAEQVSKAITSLR